jgi:hypothetical protein
MKTSEGLQTRELAVGDRPVPSSPPEDYSSPAIRPENAATYIADIVTELAGLARGSKLEILAYLLDIAQLEAANNAKRLRRETCSS